MPGLDVDTEESVRMHDGIATACEDRRPIRRPLRSLVGEERWKRVLAGTVRVRDDDPE